MASTPNLCNLLHITIFLLLSFFNLTQSAELCNPKDKAVLLEIKNHFKNSPKFFSDWNPEKDCCHNNWNGVDCAPDGRVNLLTIAGDDDISGVLPAAIGDLPYLAHLQIFSLPNLTGPIPPSFARLTRVKEFVITSTGVSGSVPGFLSQLRRLERLDLSSNRFTGTIPPSLSSLPSVNSFDLSFNMLTGSIPESYGAFKTGVLFQVVENKLSGPLPPSLGRANFTTLDVSRNRFTGDASFLFGRDKFLESIVLRNNKFEFDFSKVDLPRGLRLLDIAENKIFGSLPRRLGQLPLNFIDVSDNHLCGKIPTGRRLKHFGPVRFAHNKCLCGPPLPPCK